MFGFCFAFFFAFFFFFFNFAFVFFFFFFFVVVVFCPFLLLFIPHFSFFWCLWKDVIRHALGTFTYFFHRQQNEKRNETGAIKIVRLSIKIIAGFKQALRTSNSHLYILEEFQS